MVRKDQRGLVLSGVTLLLVLPALLISASFLTVLKTGGEGSSIQSISDKVSYVGRDVERMVKHLSDMGITLDEETVRNLSENYEKVTGVSVEIGTGVYDIWENVHEDPGDDSYPHYAWSGYCEIKTIDEGKWWYSFEDLDPRYNREPDNDRNEPRLIVEQLDNGDVRVTVDMYDGGYYCDVWFGDELLWENVNNPDGNHIGESKVVSSPPRLISIDVKDPRVTARWTKNVSLD